MATTSSLVTTVAPTTTTTAVEPQQLPGIDERTSDGDIRDADGVLSEAQLNMIAEASSADCGPATGPPGQAAGGATTVVVVVAVEEGCLTVNSELVDAGNISEELAAIRSRADVITADVATGAVPLAEGPDPNRADQWFLDATDVGLNVDALDALERRQSAPVRVAVVDGGSIDGTHPDLAGVDIVHADWAGAPTGHATHVAGIIAATADNATLGRGIARNVMLIDAPAGPEGTSLQTAISWAVDQGAQVINLSLCETAFEEGDPCIDEPNAATQAVITAARNKGVMLFAAAGNCGNPQPDTSAWTQCDQRRDVLMWPAAYWGVVGVAAYGRDGERYHQSTQNNIVDVSAPGRSILSAWYPEPSRWASGTSMASPMAAGSAAVLAGHRPDLSADLIISALLAQARDAGPAGWDTFFGAGRIDPVEAAEHLDETNPWRPLSLESLRSVPVPMICGFGPGVLVDGDLPGIEPAWVSLGDTSALGDIDGDGRDELAVNFLCGGGGVSWPDQLVVVDDDSSVLGVVDLATVFDDINVWRAHVSVIEFADGVFTVSGGFEVDASEYYERTFMVSFRDGGLVVSLPQPPSRPPIEEMVDVNETECTEELGGTFGVDSNGTVFLCIPGYGWDPGEE
ncbi:MAG: S8 family serine peptidase [Acidimicrobiia bacterium]